MAGTISFTFGKLHLYNFTDLGVKVITLHAHLRSTVQETCTTASNNFVSTFHQPSVLH